MSQSRNRRTFIAGGAALTATVVAACSPQAEPEQTAPASGAPPAPDPKPEPAASSASSSLPVIDVESLPAQVTVQLETDKGPITLVLEARKAPLTVANFLMYLETGKWSGAEFWRAMKSGDGSGFIQAEAAGIPFPPIAHESTKATGLSHTNGAISMARYAVGTATKEFIICVGDMTYMDAGRDPRGDNEGYAVFGRVTRGMNVVRSILNGKIDTNTVAGGWDGQMLAQRVAITNATRLN